MNGLLIPEQQRLILPPGVGLKPGNAPWGTRRRRHYRVAPLTPSGPGTHTGLPSSTSETAKLTGGQGFTPAIVAVGTNAVMFSTDPLNLWVSGTPAAPIQWRGVANNNRGRWVKVANTGGAFRSAFSNNGGATWTPSSVSLDVTKTWEDVAWSELGQQFVAIANGGGLNTQRIATSPDGDVWTTLTHLAVGALVTITDAPEIGAMYTIYSGVGGMLRSLDGGNTWASIAGTVGTTHVAWNGTGLWVCGGGDIFIYFSPDGGATFPATSAAFLNGFKCSAVSPHPAPILLGIPGTLTDAYRAVAPTIPGFTFAGQVVDGTEWRYAIYDTVTEHFFGLSSAGVGNSVFASPTGLAGSFTFPTAPVGIWAKMRSGLS